MSTQINIHICKVRLGMREILEKKITAIEMSRKKKSNCSAKRKICDRKREREREFREQSKKSKFIKHYNLAKAEWLAFFSSIAAASVVSHI